MASASLLMCGSISALAEAVFVVPMMSLHVYSIQYAILAFKSAMLGIIWNKVNNPPLDEIFDWPSGPGF